MRFSLVSLGLSHFLEHQHVVSCLLANQGSAASGSETTVLVHKKAHSITTIVWHYRPFTELNSIGQIWPCLWGVSLAQKSNPTLQRCTLSKVCPEFVRSPSPACLAE